MTEGTGPKLELASVTSIGGTNGNPFGRIGVHDRSAETAASWARSGGRVIMLDFLSEMTVRPMRAGRAIWRG